MKRILAPLALILVTGCAPLIDQQPDQPTEQPAVQGEVLSVGEGEASMEMEQAEEITPVERLLPSGLLEIGDRDAPLVLMMFTEHHCRYCRDFHHDHFPKLHKEFIEPGKLRLQIGILPLKKYEDSEYAAKALLCGGTQGKGMPMHSYLLEVGVADKAELIKHVAALELDTELFTACMESPDTQKTVERQKSLARTLNVTLVPTFFLDGEKSVGLPYYADLKGMIEDVMND